MNDPTTHKQDRWSSSNHYKAHSQSKEETDRKSHFQQNYLVDTEKPSLLPESIQKGIGVIN